MVGSLVVALEEPEEFALVQAGVAADVGVEPVFEQLPALVLLVLVELDRLALVSPENRLVRVLDGSVERAENLGNICLRNFVQNYSVLNV
nr:hypothetical protein [Halostagnicola kamekurae]